MIAIVFITVLVLASVAFLMGRRRAIVLAAGQPAKLHSRPNYHGMYCFLMVLLVGWGLLLVVGVGAEIAIDRMLETQVSVARPEASSVERQLIISDARALATGALASADDSLRQSVSERFARFVMWRNWAISLLVLGGALVAAALCLRRISVSFRARNRAESMLRKMLAAMALIAVLTTVGIVLSLVFETFGFFRDIGWRVDKFLFGLNWSPLSGVMDGQLDPDRVGAVPLFAGTFLITLIAMFVAVPVGLFAAIYLSDFASSRARAIVKPMLELLAGIPTVVYGFFAALTVAPALRNTGETLGLTVASESALVAGVVMGIMIIPFISSLSDDVINAVPQALRDGSYGLGATRAETIRQVVLPAALPGIVSAVLLGMSRAIGETMIVVMAAGQGPNLTANPLAAVTTVTVQIVSLITGDTEASTAAGPAFALGFTLFCITLLMNVFAQKIVHRFREAYD